MLEDIKITIEDPRGLYSRGIDDAIPRDHFKTCYNVLFDQKQIASRPGTLRTYEFGFHPTKVFLGSVGAYFADHFFLILDDNCCIHRDNGPTILTVPGMQDFSALNLYDKVYISPNFGTETDKNEHFLWVYDGTNAPRLAGGLAPTATVLAETSASDGVVTAGIHKFAVSFVTNSGFITPPSSLEVYDAPGDKAVDLSEIPTGPPECVGRRILATKADEGELFFVPGTGIIENNTTTNITVDFADTDLVSSADYLWDLFERIPAGTQIVFYKGRLCVIGGNDLVLVSHITDPETFSKVNGYLALPAEDYHYNRPVSGWVLRDTLYISKFPGVYAAQDTGDANPSNWPISPVDESIGCYPNGIGTCTAQFAGRSTSDYNIILTQQGICLFDGVFRRPPMTWKIGSLWEHVVQDEVNNPYGVNYNFWRFTVAHDPVLKRFYVNAATLVPQDITPHQWFVLYGDYATGWDAENIRWAFWFFPFICSSVVLALHPIDNKYTLRITSFTETKMWSLDVDEWTDDGKEIVKQLTTGLLDKEVGMLTYFLGVQLRAKGYCMFALTLTDGERTTGQDDLPAIVDLYVDSDASKDWLRLTNFTSEKAQLSLTTNGIFDISRIEIKCKPMFLQRPQVPQVWIPRPISRVLRPGRRPGSLR